jgi:hypothetical protein
LSENSLFIRDIKLLEKMEGSDGEGGVEKRYLLGWSD